ncbi:hypothetical protein [Rubritalea sp.]|uniref:hypothetical protein n=1 Tax=Rubritalea sp. TaxID=2109375 RepID=UPI003EF90177
MTSSMVLLCILSSCEKPSSTVAQQSDVKVYSETSGENFDESEFSKWMSKADQQISRSADQQIAYDSRDPNTYFAYTEGRSQSGFQQFRHVIKPLPVETHSEWGVI